MLRRRLAWGLGIAVAALVGCSGTEHPRGVDGGAPIGTGCSDLFQQDMVRTYSIDIDPAEWQSLDAEFHNLGALAAGNDFATYHPIVFHLDQETVSNAAIKLHGQSSWMQTVMLDGDRAKMQFTIAFDKVDPNGKFHGVDKLIFDMPRSDWTFLHDRLAHAWLRQTGIMAACAASARLIINGSLYGLYAVEEEVGRGVVKQFFPANADGDLWKGGSEIETNKAAPNLARKEAFWNATDLGAVSAIVDVEGSVSTWAAEALLNNADGYYGGFHNFFIYDQGQKGFVFLPQDTDATFDWLAVFDLPGAADHPVFWWETRGDPKPLPGQHWVIVMSDPGWRRKYADAIAAHLGRWDVAQIQGWIDSWSRQIAGDVVADPHTWASGDDFEAAVQMAREIVATRADYLRTFVECEQKGTGADGDGDGVRWCDDCRDDDATIHLGAAERCNGQDDNCNGTIDEACQ
jgi:CotH protein/putative metal-binding protein